MLQSAGIEFYPSTKFRFVSACAVDGLIYAIGGGALVTPETSAVEAYDPKTDTWVSKAPLPTSRGGPAVCAVDGIIYAIGGLIGTASAGNIQALRTVEAYDPKTDQWTPRRNLPVAVTGAAVGAVNGQVYLFFDYSTFAYDPKTDQWTRKASIPSSSLMCMLTAFSTVNGIIYLYGGEISPFEGG